MTLVLLLRLAQKAGNESFKSNSTNTFLFRDDQFESNWNKPGLLMFPKLKPQLKQERQVQRELHKEIVKKFETRQESDESQRLKRYDVEINLQRMLFKNEKYLGLCRNKRKVPSIFSNALMHKLKHNGKTNTNDIGFETEVVLSCRRFEDNFKRYEERCLKEIFEPQLRNHHYQKLPKIGQEKNAETSIKKIDNDDDEDDYTAKKKLNASTTKQQFQSTSINDFSKLPMAQQRTSTMIESPDTTSEQAAANTLAKSSFVSTSMPMLKPKQQIASHSSFKKKPVLPAIVKQQKEKTKVSEDNNDEDDDDSVF